MDLEHERTLVEKTRTDSSAFEELYQEYFPKILNYVFRRVLDPALTQDLTSEVFFKAYKNLWQFHWRKISFGAWLYRIAGNEMKLHFRSKKHIHFSLEEMKEKEGFEPIFEQSPKDECVEAEEILKQKTTFLKIQKKLLNFLKNIRKLLLCVFMKKRKFRK